ncbi:MAG: FeoA domain-containing protein, partial [Promethearchaeota archaeon]
APLGDPLEINVREYKLSLRRDEVKDIYIILDE